MTKKISISNLESVSPEIARRFKKVASRHTDDVVKTFNEGKDDPFSIWARIKHDFEYELKVHGIEEGVEYSYE